MSTGADRYDQSLQDMEQLDNELGEALSRIQKLEAALARRDKLLRVAIGALELVDSVLSDAPNAEFIRRIEAELAESVKAKMCIPPEIASKVVALFEACNQKLAEPGPFDPDSQESRIVNEALDRVAASLTLEERMKKVDERIAIKSVPPFGPIK